MNQSLVKQIAESWKLAAPPVRPNEAVVDEFRRALPSGNGWRGLVQGATPEVVDLMLFSGAKHVVSMDLHRETMEAMRLLASEDWSAVDMIVGDWTEDRPELHSAFDIVINDGGPLFLPFPVGWRELYQTTYEQLAPGGKTVFRTFTVPEGHPPLDEFYEKATRRFEDEKQGRTGDELKSLFVQFASTVMSASLAEAVAEDGTILEERMWPAWQFLETDLGERYGDGPLQAVVSALFDRTNPVGEDGTHLVAAPPESLFRPVLEECGFDVNVVTVDEPEMPGWNLVVTAAKS